MSSSRGGGGAGRLNVSGVSFASDVAANTSSRSGRVATGASASGTSRSLRSEAVRTLKDRSIKVKDAVAAQHVLSQIIDDYAIAADGTYDGLASAEAVTLKQKALQLFSDWCFALHQRRDLGTEDRSVVEAADDLLLHADPIAKYRLLQDDYRQLKGRREGELAAMLSTLDVIDMLKESHRSLTDTNRQLLRELDEQRSRHAAEVQQLHDNYTELRRHLDTVQFAMAPRSPATPTPGARAGTGKQTPGASAVGTAVSRSIRSTPASAIETSRSAAVNRSARSTASASLSQSSSSRPRSTGRLSTSQIEALLQYDPGHDGSSGDDSLLHPGL